MQSYAPALIQPSYSVSQAASLALAKYSSDGQSSPFDTSTPYAALQWICNILSERIAREMLYDTAMRRSETYSGFPPLGGLCVLNQNNDDDLEEKRRTEDYTMVEMYPGDLGDSVLNWQYPPPQIPTPWTEHDRCV
jgi:hypothetical protein